MKITVAMDSMKESLSSLRCGEAVREGILRADKNARVFICPVSDGGEGLTEALTMRPGSKIKKITVTGPLGEKVNCEIGITPENTAVIESAKACGLALVPQNRRNPSETTTYGIGEMILAAMEEGCRDFIIGLGGSSTNDCGVGMLAALGFGLYDEEGNECFTGAKSLGKIVRIENTKNKDLSECRFRIACDVTNPLVGEKGASEVFSRQKGADDRMVREMDRDMALFADKAESFLGESFRYLPGAGAAGGLGFAFCGFLRGRAEPGISLVTKAGGIEEYIKNSDIVVTGEGRLDSQTVMGKAPIGIARIAKKYGKKVVAFCGCASEDAGVCNEAGIDAYFPILRKVTTLEEALREENAYNNLRNTAEQVFRLINIK